MMRHELAVALVFALGVVSACDEQFDEDGSSTRQEPCPAQLPQEGTICHQVYQHCVYMSCDDVGVASATCTDNEMWTITTTACVERYCENEICAPGMVCVRHVAGYPRGECVENPCDAGPIGCTCPGCADNDPCEANGLTITCNECHADICA